MYIKKLTIWFFMFLSVALAACSDATDFGGGDTPDVPSEGVVLTLKLPNFAKNTVATRAATQQIRNISVLCYDADEKFLGMSDITGADIKPNDDGTYKVKVKVMEGTATLHVVTNATLTDSDAKDAEEKINLYKAIRSDKIDTDAPVCWGSITVAELLNGNASLSLLRQFAKTSVTKDASLTDFEITGFRLFGTASSGTIATRDVSDVALPSVNCSGKTNGYVSGEQPFYETPADKAYMIICAKYKGGAETYYKVVFLNKKSDGTAEPMALLRNHHYQVKVMAVNHEGWSKEQEAIDNPPENRLTVEVKDDNPPIVDMIACKDYELGVCGERTVLGKSRTATVTFVTTKPGFDFDVACSDSWITKINKTPIETVVLPTASGDSQRSSIGRLYTIELTLAENFNSEPRTGKLTITSGDLSREIKITQLGYDFRTDINRKVQIRGLAGLTSEEQADYFNWMDTSLKGITPEDNQGKVRNDGLHFFVGNNPVYYLIPKLPGDKLTCKDARVKVDEKSVSGFYKVMLANNSDESKDLKNYNTWVSHEAFTILTITNDKNNITITYPVYHVGLFGRLAGKAAGEYQFGDRKASGWYYYEMVDVKAGGKTYHMLDRNLGATTNAYYNPGTTVLKGNRGAIGGYFKISVAETSDEAKKDNYVVNSLAIDSFKVCDNACLQNLIDDKVLKIEAKKTATGEVYNCLCMNTASSELPQITIPMSGYYEGATYKDEYHANLWTRTRLSDYQGFSASSPEYGFWYLYLDAFGRTLNMSNYRFVSGSSGASTGRYRAMPVRLVAE